MGGITSEHIKTLQTLTYLSIVSRINFQVFGHLPSLRNLTVVCLRYMSTFYEVHHNDLLHQKTQLPLLECLHLSYFDTEPLFKHDEFRCVSPELTHPRLSGWECYPQSEKLPSWTNLLVQTSLALDLEQQSLIPHEDLFRRAVQSEGHLVGTGPQEILWAWVLRRAFGLVRCLFRWKCILGVANQVTIDELVARTLS